MKTWQDSIEMNKNRIISFEFRYNARGFDLNRNFPDYFKPNTKREQPETDAVKDWIAKIQFVLSGSLHGEHSFCRFLKSVSLQFQIIISKNNLITLTQSFFLFI